VRSQNCEKRLWASSFLSVCLSIRHHGTTPLPLDGFSWKFIFKYFFENLSIKFKFLVSKTNRCTEFQFVLVITTLRVSGSLSAHHQELLSRTTALVQFMQLDDRVLPGSGRKWAVLSNRIGDVALSMVIAWIISFGSWSFIYYLEFLSGSVEIELISGNFRSDPGSTRSPSCINCTSAVVRLRSSWWWAERLPETCRVVITNKNWNSVLLLVLFTRNLSRCTVVQS
jgi:hypothetical protein